jgi:hypothetical protein
LRERRFGNFVRANSFFACRLLFRRGGGLLQGFHPAIDAQQPQPSSPQNQDRDAPVPHSVRFDFLLVEDLHTLRQIGMAGGPPHRPVLVGMAGQ